MDVPDALAMRCTRGAWHFSRHWKRFQCGTTAAQKALLAHGRDAGETLRLAMALAAGMRMAAADQPG